MPNHKPVLVKTPKKVASKLKETQNNNQSQTRKSTKKTFLNKTPKTLRARRAYQK